MDTERFYRYLQFEKRFSEHTLLAYRRDLNAFSRFLGEVYELHEPDQAGHDMIRSWLVSLMESGSASSTVGRKLSVLRSYYRFLLREGLIGINPTLKVRAPKLQKRLPAFLEESTMTRILENRQNNGGFGACRDRIILETFYQTGIRLAELISLKEEDLDLITLQLRVTGKRRKERIIPFGPVYGQLLEEYLMRKKREEFDNNPEVLFVTNKGEKLSRGMVYRLVKKYLEDTAATGRKSPHVLRHTFATHLLDHGADLNAVKELLGHASLAATQVYTHNSVERLRKVYKQAHPKG